MEHFTTLPRAYDDRIELFDSHCFVRFGRHSSRGSLSELESETEVADSLLRPKHTVTKERQRELIEGDEPTFLSILRQSNRLMTVQLAFP